MPRAALTRPPSGDPEVFRRLGTRFLGQTHRVLYYWHSVGNWMLTTLSNMLSNVNLSDMECCYKAFRAGVIKPLRLTAFSGPPPRLKARPDTASIRFQAAT